MYLGTATKRNGSYSPQFSKSLKKSWAYWMELSEVETGYYLELKQAIKNAQTAPNLPTKLSLLAVVNGIKTRIDNDQNISGVFKQSVIDLF